jgi:TonB family protein
MKIRTILIVAISFFALMTSHANNNNDKDKENAVTSAQFAGGEEALQQYIKAHLVYPSCAREKALEGTVKVSFFVLPDGSIHNARVVEGMDEVCDQVALRCVENMPNWKPATQNGQAAASKVTMNISFQLEE